MKILAFTDIHGSSAALKKISQKIKSQNPDIIVCTGDISVFEQGIFGILRKLNKLGRKIVMIHGNHEDDRTFFKYSKTFRNIIFVHKRHFQQNGVLFLGYGGGGFSIIDKEFEKTASSRFKPLIKSNKGKKIILLTHAPPYKTRLDKLADGHCGNKSIRQFIGKNKVDLHICGHLHENFGKEDKIKKTIVINPWPFGKIIRI